MPGNDRLPYGTDKNIRNTSNDPVYQTQQTGIEGFTLDVPDGEYSLTLYFAELQGEPSAKLAYNLDNKEAKIDSSKGVFDVTINGNGWIKDLNIAEEYGVANAVKKSINVSVKNKEGINIRFIPIKGEPVLNALQLKKIN